MANSRPELELAAGEVIFQQGKEFQDIYVILSGTVEDQINPDFKITLEIGSIVNYANILSKVAVSTCKATNNVVLKIIPKELLFKILRSNSSFEERVIKSSLIYSIKTNLLGVKKVLKENKNIFYNI